MDDSIVVIHIKSRPETLSEKTELAQVALKLQTSSVIVLQLDVDTSGKVLAVSSVRGPRQLVELYGEQAKQTRFYPFMVNGQAVCARFSFQYAQVLGGSKNQNGKIDDQLNSLLRKCASDTGKAKAGTLSSCQLAAETSDKVSPTPNNNRNRVSAYSTYAAELLRDDRPKEALIYAQRAVTACDYGFISVTEKATAYGLRAQARGLTGDLQGSTADSLKAEDLLRATFEVPRTTAERKDDSRILNSVLNFHAQILTKLGDAVEADQLRREARKL